MLKWCTFQTSECTMVVHCGHKVAQGVTLHK